MPLILQPSVQTPHAHQAFPEDLPTVTSTSHSSYTRPRVWSHGLMDYLFTGKESHSTQSKAAGRLSVAPSVTFPPSTWNSILVLNKQKSTRLFFFTSYIKFGISIKEGGGWGDFSEVRNQQRSCCNNPDVKQGESGLGNKEKNGQI